MDARSAVFDVHDEICGWGRLVHTQDGDWLDPPLPVPLIGYLDGPPAPSPSGFATRVEGADLDAVQQRYERDGAIEGYAMVYGRWLGDRISVLRQTDDRPREPRPSWSDPPCAAPPGGWPRSPHGDPPEILGVDLGDLEETGAAVTVVVFHPRRDQAVLVIAAGDIAAVEAHVRPQLPDQLCVVASRWTRDQLDTAHQHLMTRWQRWGVYGIGRSCDEQAQATVTASPVRVTDEIARWADAQPVGLVSLEPCLAPAWRHRARGLSRGGGSRVPRRRAGPGR